MKKWIATVTCCLMSACFLLAGCGEEEQKPSGGNKPGTPSGGGNTPSGETTVIDAYTLSLQVGLPPRCM